MMMSPKPDYVINRYHNPCRPDRHQLWIGLALLAMAVVGAAWVLS